MMKKTMQHGIGMRLPLLLAGSATVLLAACGGGGGTTTTSQNNGPTLNPSTSSPGLEISSYIGDAATPASITFNSATQVNLTNNADALGGVVSTSVGQSNNFSVAAPTGTRPGIYRLVFTGTDSANNAAGELFLVDVYPGSTQIPQELQVNSSNSFAQTVELARTNIFGSTQSQPVSLTKTDGVTSSSAVGVNLVSASLDSGTGKLALTLTLTADFSNHLVAVPNTSSDMGVPVLLNVGVTGTFLDNGQNPAPYRETIYLVP
jgi:hypothetical protein